MIGSFYYIQLQLQTVATQSQDEDALDSLGDFPEAIEEGYENLLKRIGTNVRPKEIEAFKVLIRWVAFSKRDLSLNEARSLVQLKTQYSTYNPRAPIIGKLASILAISDVLEPVNMGPMDDRPTLHRSYTSLHDFLEEDDEEEENLSENTSEVNKDTQRLTNIAHDKGAVELLAENGEATISMKVDIKDWFRKATRTSKLVTNPVDAKIDLSLTCLNVLSSIDQDPMFEKQKPLHNYAKLFWLEHLKEVNLGEISNEQMSSIMEKLVDVFTVPGTACHHFETVPSKIYLKFHLSTDEDRLGRELIITWCKKVLESTVKLRPRTREWIEAVIERPERILDNLAKEHVIKFCRSENNDTLPSEFSAAFFSAITVRGSLILSRNAS